MWEAATAVCGANTGLLIGVPSRELAGHVRLSGNAHQEWAARAVNVPSEHPEITASSTLSALQGHIASGALAKRRVAHLRVSF